MASNIKLENVQGDIITGLPKKAESFILFEIKDVAQFRDRFAKVVPFVASATKVADLRTQIKAHKAARQTGHVHMSLLNVAFSHKGLTKLGIDPTIGQETAWAKGMLADAKDLGDKGKVTGDKFEPEWRPEFKKSLDGIFLVAGDCKPNIDRQVAKVLITLGPSINKVAVIEGHVRPGAHDGQEHFGFEDGISNPVIQGLGTDLSGQGPVDPSVILIGQDGPTWARDGSFLVFRYLQQLVPEFNKFLSENAIKIPNDPSINGAELLGARMTGRWHSGAPVELTPLKDDPVLAKDPNRNNKFTHTANSQERCPFAAHTRKMNPRGDIPGEQFINPHRIMRRGIQFGPEVKPQEDKAHKTSEDRGLLFACYQGSIESGFRFLQKSWANNVGFPPSNNAQPGFDPLIGQVEDADNVGVRAMTGTDPNNVAASLSLGVNTWVVTRGGEYFFSPSIPTLRNVIAKEDRKDL